MRDRIEIELEAEDRLFKERWAFYTDIDPGKFLLDHYEKSSRPSTRHKYKIDSYYSRPDTRHPSIKRTEVPWSGSILFRLKQKLRDQIDDMVISEK